MTDTFRHLGVCTGLFFCLLGSPEGAAAQTTALFLDSEPGDYVGQGLTQTLLPGVNQFSPSISSDRSTINLYVTSADVYWYLNFAMPGRLPFAPGVYENAIGWSSSSTPPPILEVRNLRGGGCSSSVGRFIVYELTVDSAGALVRFAADFEQYCDGGARGLFGAIRINSTRSSLNPFNGAYPVYSLHVESAPNGFVTGQGINCGAGRTDCDETYQEPAGIALEAVPSPGYLFLGWAGPDCSGDEVAVVAVTRRATCLPVFNRQPGSPGAESPDYSQGAFFIDGVIGTSSSYPYTAKTGRQVHVDLPPGSVADSSITVDRATTADVDFRIIGSRGVEWRIEFSGRPGELLSTGSYNYAVANRTSRGQVPHLALAGYTASGTYVNCTSGGRFVIYEMTLSNGLLTAFAADFEVSCGDNAVRTAGSIRYRSSRASLLAFNGAYPLYQLTLVPVIGGFVTGAGISCGDGGRTDCNETYSDPDYVGLEATASSGYQFIGWSKGCGSGGGSIATIYVDRALRCFPIFSPAPSSVQPGDPLLGSATLLLEVPSAFPSRTLLLGREVGINVFSDGGGSRVSFAFNPPTGNQASVTFISPGGTLVPGDYEEATWSPGVSLPGLTISDCYSSIGRFRVHEATYDNAGALLTFAADFEAFCGSSTIPYVAGVLRFNSTRTKLVPFDGVYPAHKLKIEPAVNGIVTGAGIDCGPGRSDCSESYAAVTTAPLVAIPLPGYRFVAWSGKCDGSTSTTVVVQWIERCAAVFDPIVAGTGVVDPRVMARALYIDSQPGDQLGRNRRHVWLDGDVFVSASARSSVRASYYVPEGSWQLEFYAPLNQDLRPGVYTNASYPFNSNRTGPGMYIYGPSRTCSSGLAITGRFVIHEIAFNTNGIVTSLSVDFEHRCSPTAPPMYGSLRYNATRTQLQPFPPAQTTRVIGDWNGDGMVDLVWQNRATGHLAAWLMNGTTQIDNLSLAPDQVADTNWHIVGAADANQDGYTDIYWQHQTTGALSVWYMIEAVRAGSASLTPGTVADTAWKVRTVTDLDRDGHPDLIWQHTGNGAVAVWFMNGVQMRSGELLQPERVTDLGWKIVGAGDANGDGTPDLFWHHQTTGDLAVWFMNGRVSVSGQSLSPGRVADTRWQVRGVRDLDGNGSPDVIWQNTSTFQASVWLLNGLTVIDGRMIAGPTLPNADWYLVSPK